MKIIQGCACLLALAFGVAALAQEPGHGPQVPPFADVDADKNGYISVTEAQSAPELNSMFGELDTNNDDQLDAEEYGKAAEIR